MEDEDWLLPVSGVCLRAGTVIVIASIMYEAETGGGGLYLLDLKKMILIAHRYNMFKEDEHE